jgi:hypothetical protein
MNVKDQHQAYRESTRISKSVKADRDLLIYIAWQIAVANNREIGKKFGLTLFSCKSAGKSDKGKAQER